MLSACWWWVRCVFQVCCCGSLKRESEASVTLLLMRSTRETLTWVSFIISKHTDSTDFCTFDKPDWSYFQVYIHVVWPCVCLCRRTSWWWSSETWFRPTRRSASSSCQPPSTPPCSESISSTVPSSRCSDAPSLFKVPPTTTCRLMSSGSFKQWKLSANLPQNDQFETKHEGAELCFIKHLRLV